MSVWGAAEKLADQLKGSPGLVEIGVGLNSKWPYIVVHGRKLELPEEFEGFKVTVKRCGKPW